MTTGIESTPHQLLVLGGGLEPDGSANATTLARAQAAVAYFQDHTVERIVYSGHSSPLTTNGEIGDASEAVNMAQYGLEHGIPEAYIITESSSRSTIGNLVLTAHFFDPSEPVGLITGEGVMNRALKTAARVWGKGPEIVPLPVPEAIGRLRKVQEAASTLAMEATLFGVKPGDLDTALQRTELFQRITTPLAPLLRRTLHRDHTAVR